VRRLSPLLIIGLPRTLSNGSRSVSILPITLVLEVSRNSFSQKERIRRKYNWVRMLRNLVLFRDINKKMARQRTALRNEAKSFDFFT
jgi:hypothetical protein